MRTDTRPDAGAPPVSWSDPIPELFASHEVRVVSTVPDGGLAALIRCLESDDRFRLVPLTNEGEGVALAAGAWLGGVKSAILMQSSGVGNCVNMLTLPISAQIPLLMIVTMRGDQGERNPLQMPLGEHTEEVLRSVGVVVKRARDTAEVEATVSDALHMAFSTYRPVAVLISQSIIGAKDFRVGATIAEPAR